MKTDLISRSAVLDRLEMFRRNYRLKAGYYDAMTDAIGEVRYAPNIDAVPAVHAYWIGLEYDGYADGFPVFDTWGCSACGEEYSSEGEPPAYNYCHNCGARMDAKENKCEFWWRARNRRR